MTGASRADKLALRILDDRVRQAERQQKRQQERQRDRGVPIGFDPYSGAKWKVIAGPDPGYLPKTPMRPGPAGFYIHCKACNAEFESKGLAYCVACMALPAEERHGMAPAHHGRMCQASGCENQIRRAARAGTRFCSPACRQRGARMSRETPPHP